MISNRIHDTSKMKFDKFIHKISLYLPKSFTDLLYSSETFESIRKIQCFTLLSTEKDEFFTKKLRLRFFVATSLLMTPLMLSCAAFMFHTLRGTLFNGFIVFDCIHLFVLNHTNHNTLNFIISIIFQIQEYSNYENIYLYFQTRFHSIFFQMTEWTNF